MRSAASSTSKSKDNARDKDSTDNHEKDRRSAERLERTDISPHATKKPLRSNLREPRLIRTKAYR